MESIAVLLVFIVVVVGGLYWLLCWYEKRQKNAWKLAAEGAYERSEVRSSVIAARRVGKMGLMVVTTLFFQDGKTWPILGVIFNPPARGTKIRVYKNGFGEPRIEVLADQAA